MNLRSLRRGRRSVSARRVGDHRRALVLLGWVAAAVVALNTALAGLPADAAARVAVPVLTAVALALWLAGLARTVTNVWLLTGCLAAGGLCGAVLDLLHPSGPGFILAYMAMAAIGLRLPRPVALPTGALVVVAAAWAESRTSTNAAGAALNLGIGAGFLFVASAFAAVNRDAHAQAQALLAEEAAARAAREQAAVLAERGRLARELHDVLAHTLSGLAVQLEGARLLAEKTGAGALLVTQIRTAQRLARDGMVSAKGAVATLRGDALPGIDHLPDLVTQARLATGTAAHLVVSGEPRALPPESGLAVYRTVQEALTNTAKHAGPDAGVTVTLTWAPDDVTVEIVDTGGAPATDLPPGGFGLTGLAERAELAGGHLDAGPTVDGWRVHLVMPTRAPQENQR
ncbi:sensor histidine kinase [Micromonospora narathiwatensis]|uniref:histidine kinase n=1 Tax=Micromonospora narathiwatensis TaxID=299146 RepID=A0A1A8ZRR3_9ACTN|nr:histidine kinase [Micromonospora narathiwatensis]SBT46578.1 Signal transduction histidine kinase [Micromonospora narathiwatensis]